MQYGSYFELLIYLGNMMATIIAIAYAKNVPRPYCTISDIYKLQHPTSKQSFQHCLNIDFGKKNYANHIGNFCFVK